MPRLPSDVRRASDCLMVAGSLEEIDLAQLVQAYCRGHQTARIVITHPEGEGSLSFDRGDLVDAELGALTGKPAVRALLARKGGEFRVELAAPIPRRTITEHWSSVLRDCLPKGVVLPPPLPSAAVRASSGAAPPATGTPAGARATTTNPRTEAVPPLRTRQPTGSSHDTQPRLRLDRPPSRPGAPAARKRSFLSRAGSPPLVAAIAGASALVVLLAAAVWYPKHSGAMSASASAAVRQPVETKRPVVTLGMSAPFTGPARELGRQMKLGVETCLKQANDAGGVNGRNFELVALDDGYEPDRTRETMKELVEQRKVFAIIGNVGTPTAEVAVPYALQKRILFFGAFTGASLLRKEPPDRYVFNYRAGYVEETAAAVRYLVEVRKIQPRQIAVFAQQDGFGDAGFAGVTKALRRYGRDKDQILRVGFKRNTLEIEDAVAEIAKKRDQIRAIVMVAPYRPAARFIEKLKEKGLDPVFTNVSFVGSTALADELRQLGPKYSDGVIVTQVVPPVDSSATAVMQYRDALQRYFRGEKPDFVSLEGYIATKVLLEGFRRAGPQPTTESLIDSLESIRGLDLGVGTQLSFGLSEHQASHKVWGTVLDNKADYHVFDLE